MPEAGAELGSEGMRSGGGNRGVRVMRWIARIGAGLAAAVMLLFFVGEGLAEGLAPLLDLSFRESAMMVAFAAVWVSLLLGWRWELVGGLLTLSGLAAFYVVDYALSGTFPRGPTFFLFASPGLLFLACALWSRRMEMSPQG